MAAININIKKVRNANGNLPPIISNLAAYKKNISMLKWRIPSEIQGKRNIGERFNIILHEMDRVEQQLNDIYKVTGSAVTQYMRMETNLTVNASKFR